MDAATIYARENLVQGCKELKEWSDTSLLPDGVVCHTASILTEMDIGETLSLARAIFSSLAIERCARL